jgi:hypothetical protein
MVFAILLMVMMTLSFSVIVFAGQNNANGDNGYQGTNKDSSQLPAQSNVPPPAGLVEDIFAPGAPYVVEGCRADGGDEMVYVGGLLGEVLGGTCCASHMHVDESISIYPLPNQCCNPPDILYEPEEYTPGNHCLCFVMRF